MQPSDASDRRRWRLVSAKRPLNDRLLAHEYASGKYRLRAARTINCIYLETSDSYSRLRGLALVVCVTVCVCVFVFVLKFACTFYSRRARALTHLALDSVLTQLDCE